LVHASGLGLEGFGGTLDLSDAGSDAPSWRRWYLLRPVERAQTIIAETLPKLFRGVFLIRRARARALTRAAKALRLATRPEVDTLVARADLALGRARRRRDEEEAGS